MKIGFLLNFLFIFFNKNICAEEPFCDNKCYSSGVTTSKQCYCDLYCSSIFNDCCVDSEYNRILNTQHFNNPIRSILCQTSYIGKNVSVIRSCIYNWQGPEFVKRSCEGFSNVTEDPTGSIIVTNNITGVSYSNYFCAICNNDVQNLVFWNIQISCPTLNPNVMVDKNEALKYIFYNRHTQSWGYLIRDSVRNWEAFHSCNITSLLPRTLVANIRHCYPGEIQECLHSWKDDAIKNLCGAYTDPVYANGIRYKNFYCAMCNRVDISKISCGDLGFRHDGVFGTEQISERSNFALLLDLNLSDGNNVGKRIMSASCSKGEIFDPFVKKCRNVVCGVSGYIVKSGRCVPETNFEPDP